MSASQPTGSAPKRESVDDRTMSMILSLYISDERMQQVFANWNRGKRSEIQIGFENTKELREAIDPLFNDIAMRDRNSTLDEFLIDVQGERLVECVDVTTPKTFTWTTEGKTFRVILDEAVTKRLECRMFWYVHSNGSLSYHMSFKVNYEHSFSDFYFLSILQKMVFPKEFYPSGNVGSIDSGTTGVWVLDDKMVRPIAADAPLATQFSPSSDHQMRFWSYVRERFCGHLSHLIGQGDAGGAELAFKPDIPREHRQSPDALWDYLVIPDQVDVIEVPGLKAPAVRSAFLFKDKDLMDLLQPQKRSTMILKNANYGVRLPVGSADDSEIVITADVFNWRPAEADPRFDIRYYFLSGFFQNIIDFLNQDASEILDGTDPIYPQSDQQQDEAFFVCYANGRSVYEVVERSRSLEAGIDYIGICPYLFLVHLMALHNEFVIRRYETETKQIQDLFDQDDLTRHGNLHRLIHSIQEEAFGGAPVSVREINKATSRFYEFRYRAFTVFTRNLYDNTFRYDTERDIFTELSKIRGTTSRLARCQSIAQGIDTTMQDLEEDKRYREQNNIRESDQRLQILVFFVGLVSIMQVLFQANDAFDKLASGAVVDRIISAISIALLVLTAIGLGLVARYGRRYWLSQRRRVSRTRKPDDM